MTISKKSLILSNFLNYQDYRKKKRLTYLNHQQSDQNKLIQRFSKDKICYFLFFSVGGIVVVRHISSFRLFSLVLSSLIAIPSLIIGVVFRSRCPVQIWIPRFLIGLGVANGAECICSVVHILISTFRVLKKSDLFISIITVLSIVLFFSQPVWMIFGSVWTFGVKSHVQVKNATDYENYCHRVPYYAAYGILITGYTGIGVVLCSIFKIRR